VLAANNADRLLNVQNEDEAAADDRQQRKQKKKSRKHEESEEVSEDEGPPRRRGESPELHERLDSRCVLGKEESYWGKAIWFGLGFRVNMCACRVGVGHCAYLCTVLDVCELQDVSRVLVCVDE
jgi:hypothetical protein